MFDAYQQDCYYQNYRQLIGVQEEEGYYTHQESGAEITMTFFKFKMKINKFMIFK